MIFAIAFAVAGPSTASPCPGRTTPEVNACFDSQLDRADAELNRYYRAAMRRLRSDDQAKAADSLVRAERSWLAYRDAECGGVYTYWSGGTIRTAAEIACRIHVTKLRTYTIWRNWLTYMDSSPPILPRPDVEAAIRSE